MTLRIWMRVKSQIDVFCTLVGVCFIGYVVCHFVWVWARFAVDNWFSRANNCTWRCQQVACIKQLRGALA